eukprot:766428-Hanusia_phi.AAC.11
MKPFDGSTRQVLRAGAAVLLVLLVLAIITTTCFPPRPLLSAPASPSYVFNASQPGNFNSIKFLTFNVYGPFSGSSDVQERLEDLVRYAEKYDVIAMQEVLGLN